MPLIGHELSRFLVNPLPLCGRGQSADYPRTFIDVDRVRKRYVLGSRLNAVTDAPRN
ncbi:MAG: hypothetical protein QOF48_1110, partial [Verrucomicrobiota bacterium]